MEKNFEVYGFGADPGSECIMDFTGLSGDEYVEASSQAYEFFGGNSIDKYPSIDTAHCNYPGAIVWRWDSENHCWI